MRFTWCIFGDGAENERLDTETWTWGQIVSSGLTRDEAPIRLQNTI